MNHEMFLRSNSLDSYVSSNCILLLRRDACSLCKYYLLITSVSCLQEQYIYSNFYLLIIVSSFKSSKDTQEVLQNIMGETRKFSSGRGGGGILDLKANKAFHQRGQGHLLASEGEPKRPRRLPLSCITSSFELSFSTNMSK